MKIASLAALAMALSAQIASADDGCAGIKLWNYESVEPECIFGLCTPKTDAKTVANAVAMNNLHSWQKIEWKSQNIDGQVWTWDRYQHKYPPEGRIDFFQRFVSFHFELGPLCQLARKSGFSTLKLSCDAYSSSTAGCFVAAFRDGDPTIGDNSIDNVKRHRWGPIADNLSGAMALDWHEDRMSDPDYRTELYTELIASAVNAAYIEHTSQSPSFLPITSRDAAEKECAVSEGLPLNENDLPIHETLPSLPSQNQSLPPSIPI